MGGMRSPGTRSAHCGQEGRGCAQLATSGAGSRPCAASATPCAVNMLSNETEGSPLTSLALVMVSAMMLAAPGSSVTGMNGREEAEEADGVTAAGVTASSEEIIWFQNRGGRTQQCAHFPDAPKPSGHLSA